MRITLRLWTLTICALVACAAGAQVSAPEPQKGTIIGTVVDVQDDIIPDATVVLESPNASKQQTVTVNDNGFFSISDVKPAVSYRLTISAKGFASFTLPTVTLKPGEYLDLKSIKLQIETAVTTSGS